MTKLLTLEDILATDLPEEVVDVPAWGGAVKIRGLTREQVVACRAKATKQTIKAGKPVEEIDSAKLEQMMLTASLVEPAITEEQTAALYKKAGGPIQKIVKRILAINGLGEEAEKEAEKSAGEES